MRSHQIIQKKLVLDEFLDALKADPHLAAIPISEIPASLIGSRKRVGLASEAALHRYIVAHDLNTARLTSWNMDHSQDAHTSTSVTGRIAAALASRSSKQASPSGMFWPS